MSDLFGDHIVGFPHEAAQMSLLASSAGNIPLVYSVSISRHVRSFLAPDQER